MTIPNEVHICKSCGLEFSNLHLDLCSGGEFCTLDDCLCGCHVSATDESPVSEQMDAVTLAYKRGYEEGSARPAALRSKD